MNETEPLFTCDHSRNNILVDKQSLSQEKFVVSTHHTQNKTNNQVKFYNFWIQNILFV